MSVTFNIKLPDLKKTQHRFDDASDKAQLVLATQMLKDTERYVPARTRSMTNRAGARTSQPLTQASKQATQAAINAGEPVIIYPGPYAHYLYKGKLMVDPETGSPWASKGVTKKYTSKPLHISQAVHGKAQSYWFEASKAANIEKWVRVAGRAVMRYGRQG